MKKNDSLLRREKAFVMPPKIILKMRITLLLILLSVVQLFAEDAFSQNTRFTLSEENARIENVLRKIEDQSNYYFLYNAKLIDVTKEVSIEIENQSLEKTLDVLFKDTGVEYKILNRQVVLSPVSGLNNASQTNSLTGKVVDSEGQPLPGVSISIKGTTIGTISDFDGNYVLSNVSSGSVLVFSFVGMTTQEVVFSGQNVLNITMEEDAVDIDEVVAIGYGTVGKKSLTGSIANVDMEIIDNTTNPNTISALQGAIPGLVVTRTRGEIGNEEADFEIRGATSVNEASPLVIIDDIPYTDHTALSSLNPNDIANVSVLKDAAAASIYGARAAGGVVLITTKKGKKGSVRIKYSGKVSADYLGPEWKPTTQAEYYRMFDEANQLDGIVNHRFKPLEQWMLNGNNGQPTYPPDVPFFDALDFTYADRDFSDEMWNDFSLSHYHNLSINGGNAKNTYNISLGYMDNDGLQKPAKVNLKRQTARINYDIWLTDKLQASTSVYIERDDLDKPSNMENGYIGTYPMIALNNANGDNYGFGGTQDPIYNMQLGGRSVTLKDKLNTRLKLTYNITDELNFVGIAGANFWNSFNESHSNIVTYYNFDGSEINKLSPSRNSSTKTYQRTYYQNYSAYINYLKTFNEVHQVTALIGTSYEKNKYDFFEAWRLDMITEELHSLQLGDPDEQYNNSEGNAWALGSYFARLNYSYKGKYLLQANARRDGSSRFIGDSRWGNFGGVSAGWVLSEESFFESSLFNHLKLKASYGVVGHQAGIDIYDYIQLINASSDFYPFGENPSRNITAELGDLASESRTWENVSSMNVGVDFTMLNSKLSGSFEYFKKNNDNMLVEVTLPTVLGATPPTSNFGELTTTGFETTLKWKDGKSDFKYSIELSLSDNKNEVVDLAGSNVVSLGTKTAIEGYSMYSMFGYQREGLIMSEAELAEYTQLDGVPTNLRVGDVKFMDRNGDGKISVYDDEGNLADVVHLGVNTPRYHFSISTRLKWKGFDFSAFFNGWLKHDVIRNDGKRLSSWWLNQNSYYVDNTFHPELRPDAGYPALSVNRTINNWNHNYQDWLTHNNAYMRLKNITLGYTLPASFSNKLKLGLVRVYCSGDDIWELANSVATQDGAIDPEMGYRLDIPFMRKITLGVDVNF